MMHNDLIKLLFLFNIVVGMFAVTRGWDPMGFGWAPNRFVNG